MPDRVGKVYCNNLKPEHPCKIQIYKPKIRRYGTLQVRFLFPAPFPSAVP